MQPIEEEAGDRVLYVNKINNKITIDKNQLYKMIQMIKELISLSSISSDKDRIKIHNLKTQAALMNSILSSEGIDNMFKNIESEYKQIRLSRAISEDDIK